MKKILMFPQKRTERNSYLGNLTEQISGCFDVVGFNEALKSDLKSFLFYDIVHFNWLENIRGKNIFRALVNFVIRFFTLVYFRARGKPIVWTAHNKIAHCRGKGEAFSRIMMRYLMKWSARIHVLCEESYNEIPDLKQYKDKVVCVPHGDYIGDYPESQVNIHEKYGIDSAKKIILFVGVIDAYKNVDLLIRSFCKSNIVENDFVLLVCGACPDRAYKERLVKEMGNKKGIYLDFNFVPTELMDAYLHQCTLMVAPYDKETTLNSGTLWMAFSYAKTIICPEIGCVRSIGDADKMMYCYDYDTEDSHGRALESALARVAKDFSDGLLKEKESLAFEYMKSHSWDAEKNRWIALYEF